MNNPSITLYSEEGDTQLLKDLRGALVKKGLVDDKQWNDWKTNPTILKVYGDRDRFNVVILYEQYKQADYRIPVSRNDFQTMFLLY